MSSLKYSCGLILGLLLVSGDFVSSQWQHHPINCYTCSDEECNGSVGTVQICRGTDIKSQSCVTVFGADNTVVRRGCNDDVADYCDSNSDKCFKCTSNGCNIANALSEFVECVSCDSKIDKNCVLNPGAITSTRLCRQSCMVALYARNATESSPNYELSRSCLDDKDLDDREICSKGGDELCKSCVGQKCNLDKLPESRFKCYNCIGNEDCEDPSNTECVSHNADDQCYRLFDATDDIVKLGCRSEFEEEEFVQQIKTKKLLLCDGAECNFFNTMPQPTKCFKCDSATDENCVTQPTDETTSEICGIPYTQCYSKVSNAGVTVRGCLSELSADEFYQCLLNGDKNCQSCSGAECNKVTVPADRLQCQRCSSTSDSDCHTNPSALSICPLYTQDDSCVSVYRKGVTNRGCASEFTCDPTDLKSCQVCSSQGCNTNNVKKTSEEIYGIFQGLPLKCYTCTGDECNESKGVVKQCEGSALQDCVTVFNAEGKVISRGCEHNVESSHASHCRANPELCFNCKSNECNTIAVATNYIECIYCDSATDPDCVTNVSAVVTQRKCTKGCITALYPRSSDANILELVRTCLDDVEANNVDNCGNDSTCVKCDSAKCNALAVPAARLSCNHCAEGDCEFVVPKECSAFSETDQCFMLFDETFSVKRMGCKSELTTSEVKNSIKQLFLCNGDNCNDYPNLPEANICAVCDSKSDPLCAVWPANVTSANWCQTFPHTQCYSKVGEDGSTARGCLLSLPVDDFLGCLEGGSDKCTTCSGSRCNNQVFPPNRQKCHRCISSSDAKCASLPNASEVCPLYVEGDTCVTKVVNGITSRDCGSSLTCGSLGRKDCRACSGSGCNTADLIGESVGDPGLWQDVPIKCFTCEGEDCATSTAEVQICQENKFQTCTTVFSQEGKVVSRGCSDVVATKHTTYCNENPSDCLECKSSECNLATSKADYVDCIFCDGRTNPNCTTNVIDVSRTRKCHKKCMTALYPRTSDGYTIYDLVRTCLDDKELADRESCDGDNTDCKSCTGSSCNTQLVPNIRNSCNHCSGESCQLPTTRTCNSFTRDEQCFVLFDEAGAVMEMGCKSDYDPSDIRSFLLAKRLLVCNSENCNDFDSIPSATSCRLCNSRTDPLCATEPLTVSSSTTCDRLPNTGCYSRVLAGGHTERGCLSNLDGDEFLDCYNENSTNCSTCDGILCNDQAIPADRIACYTCNSAEDSSCDGSPKNSAFCRKYSPDQVCVTSLSDGITRRGCSGELPICDTVDTTSCQTCNTTNCNVINLKTQSDASPGLWQSLPLNCYICSGDDCKGSLTGLNVCEGNRNQNCATVFGEDGGVVRRGCSDDVEKEYGTYCDETSGSCYSCNSNGCNTATSLSDYIDCIFCDSRVDTNCVADVAAVSKTRRCNKACMVALFPRSENQTDVYELSRSCLDDKDLDDRDLCGSDGSLCKVCTSAGCNVEDAVEDRLECFSCLGDSCESPVSEKCTAHAPADTCFMLFDSSSTVQQMGCTSQLTAEELEANREKLITCSGNNCNDYANIPKPQTCAACDSSSDVRCASTPGAVATVAQCSSLPIVDCYTRVKSDGHTVRGCVSDLSSSLRKSCLSGNTTSCATCNGDSCNVQVFPEDRLRCHKCNSIDDPTCQDAPNATHVCPVYTESEVCSSKLVNGATYRGCGRDFTCDDTDKQYCKMCNFTNCNRANLHQNNIGYPGKWQGLPINCFTCFREECNEPSMNLLRKCENNNLQNCVTVFNMTGKVVQRGCSDTIYEGFYDHHCDNHPELCTYCKSSGCNNADGLDDYVDCLFCDSTTDPKCALEVTGVARTRKCQKQCMTALYPRSEEVDPAYELERSCLDDKDLDDRDECLNGNDKHCKVCEGDSCNTDLIPDVRLSCYRCSGVDCEAPAQAECPAFRENDRCFILFEAESSDIAQMGCSSDLDSSVLTALQKQLLFCTGDNCNFFDIIPSPRNCLVCDSATDPLCATKPNSLANFRQCISAPYTSCITRIEGGLTKRGCLSDVEFNTIDECIRSGDDVKCNVCDAEHCNIEVYPANRLSCHRCSSDEDDSCHTSPKDPGVCPLYQEHDECVVKIVGDTTKRGCTSEFSCSVEDRETCRICSDDNCNSADLVSSAVGKPGQWQDLPLKCYQCEGAACQSSLGSINSCSGNNLQNCMTVFDISGVVVKRGCSDDISLTHEKYCDNNGGRCQSCKSSTCNNVASLDDYVDCIFCDTKTNPNCVLNPSESSRTRKCNKQCMVALYPKSSEDDPSYELSRSCLDDKDSDERDLCAGGTEEYCQACDGAKCNNNAFPAIRHQCWTCRGEDCENAKPQDCVFYHPADQCYIFFNNNNEIAAMGCRSEYERATVTELIKSQNLLLCDGERCNSYDSIPNSQDCIVCNSAVDPRCATNPNLIANATTCSSLPYTGCFTRINGDGDTVRGCQSELSSSEFYGCHTDSDSACSTCAGNKCNVDVFPLNRLKCHRCNSADDVNCAESPESNGVCPKISDGESCITAYKNGVTHRGCSSELSCDVSNKNICRVCEDSGCNTHNLEHVAKDGQPGRWQGLPINCYTCKGDDCKDSEGLLQMCANNKLQNCMTVFDANGEVIQRGCSDSVSEDQEEWCAKNLDKCYRCNSSGCNKAVKLDDYIECLSCDTASDASCVRDPTSVTKTRKCYKSCMTALFPRTAESDPSYETARTCLDDKDLDDRDTCQAGTEAFCKACDNGKCNVDQVPAERRSCFHCSGDGCQLPEEQLCTGYRANDQCFYMFDEMQSVVEMGCRSDLTIDQSNDLVKAKRLLLCDGDNCNNLGALPTSQSCALCNSRTDVRCAVNPSAVSSTTSCSVLPYTGCYSRVLDDGATERGCLSSLLGNDFFDCNIGNSTTCTACSGASCNKEVFPTNRMACHICDSSSDPNCEATPSSLGICAKYEKNESCVTSFAVGRTTRDCGTTLQCDVNNRRTCRVCTSAGCNTIDLAAKQDENFGKWQDLPLKCYHCSGPECQGELGEATSCEINNEQDCSTVFSAEGVVIRRGCNDVVDIEYDDYCDANSGRCFNCKSNECNTATALSDFTECISCDTNKDKTCVTNPLTSALRSRQCHGGCMVALYPSDSSSNPAYDLVRTCLNDKDQKDQASCSTGADASCKACIGSKCNTDDLPENRLRCHSCQGDSCEDPFSEQCPLYKEGDQCFVKYDSSSSVIEMGCLSEFRGQEIIDILKTKQVFMCEGDNCNALDKLPTPKQCTICDSATDPKCAVSPVSVGTVGTCGQLPYPNCFTKISRVSGGTTQRGCLADLEANQFAQCILSADGTCSQCLGDGCNRQIFPEDRLQCYSCSSDTNPECESLPTIQTPCLYVSDSEKCVSALGGNVTERGCSSSLLCDSSDKSTCRHCSTTGCNTLDLANRVNDENHGLWQELPLRCHSCSGEHCSNSLGIALACAGGDQQDCMTVFDENAEVIRRGCQYDVEDADDLYCRQNPDRCTICKSNECNDAWELSEYVDCIYCNSETDPSCVSHPSAPGFPTRKCHKGCMAAAFTAANGTTQVIRTCLNDKELQNQFACSVDESGRECSSCVGNSCNNFKYPKDRLTCHICQGADCSNTVAELCLAYETGDSCFAKYENGKVEYAGCSSAVDKAVIENWKQEGKLYTCEGDSCNSADKLPVPQSCVTCDSSKNVECATNPSAVTETLLCSGPVTACFSNITNGATHRGCLQSLSINQQTECQQAGGVTLCEVCSGEKCNAAVFPQDRRSCHICDSNSDDKCRAGPEVVSVCPTYLAGDQCVVKLTTSPARLTERGCSSDLQCDATDSAHCSICNTNACNVQQLDNGAYTIIANNILLTLLVAVVGLMGVQSKCF